MDSLRDWRPVPEGAMGANLVVVPPPILDEYLGFQQSCEDLAVGYIVTIHRNSDLASQAIAYPPTQKAVYSGTEEAHDSPTPGQHRQREGQSK